MRPVALGTAAPLLVLLLAACEDRDPTLRVGSDCPAEVMRAVNDHFIATHEPGNSRWARAVYFTGDLAAYQTLGEERYREFALRWAEDHEWRLDGGRETHHADDHTAGQIYLALDELEAGPDPGRVAEIRAAIDHVIASGEVGGWSWVDAFYMASPVFARLGALDGDPRYHDTMFAMYEDAKVRRGLFDEEAGLWYRDSTYLWPANRTPNGRKIFWSRGNGWVVASIVRTLEVLPADSPYTDAYVAMLRTMAGSLARAQRSDGFWGVSLDDPEDHPGPETSGTALFVYGLAWGINEGVLDRATYLPVVERAWTGLVEGAIHADGRLGWVQGVGESPGSAQPVTLDSTADFGVGALLLAGSEMARLRGGPACAAASAYEQVN